MVPEMQRKLFESTVDARVKSKTNELESRNSNLAFANDQLRKQLYEYRQEAEVKAALLTERDHLLSVIDTYKREKDLTASQHQSQLLNVQEKMGAVIEQIQRVGDENARLRSQIEQLKAKNDAGANTAATTAPPNSQACQLRAVTAELRTLQKQYDTLNRKKNKISKNYRRDWRKWKDFKQYVIAHQGNPSGIWDKFQEFQASVMDLKISEGEKSPRGAGVFSPRRLSSSSKRTPSPLKASVNYNANNEDEKDVFDDDESMTQEETCPASLLGSDSPSPQKRPDKPATCPHKTASSPKSSPSAKNTTTINAQFQINPLHNHGVQHQYQEVVRNHAERKKLLATDCDCCREYYEAVGPMPPRLEAPLWASPPEKTKTKGHHSKKDEVGKQSHKQDISRHRQQWETAESPPDFWEIGFPDTQQVENINERAMEVHRRKRRRIEEEASRPNGRYLKR